MRLGILGGTFDPIHNGHLHLAQEARDKLKLDKVIFLPAYVPPHKQKGAQAGYDDRAAMVRLAISEDSAFVFSDLERRRGGQSYTIDTLTALDKSYPGQQWFFLTGADALETFTTWHRWQDILDLATLVITTRPGFGFETPPNLAQAGAKSRFGLKLMAIDAADISSTMVRRLIAQGKPWRHLLPPKTAEYLAAKHLYGG